MEHDGIPQDARMEEAALVRALRNADRGGFARLIDRFSRPLYALVWRLLREHEETNDVLQETFVRVFENAQKLDPERPVYPYLQRIAINLAINRLKQLKRKAWHAEPEMIPNQDDPCRDAEQADLVALVEQQIGRLPDRNRVPLILHVQEGMSYEEIAKSLGIRIGTVMSRISRARLKLLRSLPEPDRDALRMVLKS